jgi:hypothetical protein
MKSLAQSSQGTRGKEEENHGGTRSEDTEEYGEKSEKRKNDIF